MSDDVRRFKPATLDSRMTLDDNGKFVSVFDYDRLRAEMELIREQRNALRARLVRELQERPDVPTEAEARSLRAEVERLKNEVQQQMLTRTHEAEQAGKLIADLWIEVKRLKPLADAAINYDLLKSCQAGMQPLLMAASDYASEVAKEHGDE